MKKPNEESLNLFESALRLFHEKSFGEATKILQDLAKQEDLDPMLAVKVGSLLSACNRLSEKGLKTPVTEEDRLSLAVFHVNRGEWEEADAVLRKLQGKVQQKGYLFYLDAAVACGKNDVERARKSFLSAVEEDESYRWMAKKDPDFNLLKTAGVI